MNWLVMTLVELFEEPVNVYACSEAAMLDGTIVRVSGVCERVKSHVKKVDGRTNLAADSVVRLGFGVNESVVGHPKPLEMPSPPPSGAAVPSSEYQGGRRMERIVNVHNACILTEEKPPQSDEGWFSCFAQT